MATPRRALAKPFDAGCELRPRIEEGRPGVGQLARALSGYRWGVKRKRALLDREAASPDAASHGVS